MIKGILTAIPLVFSLSIRAQAQSTVDCIKSEKSGSSFVRPNLLYSLGNVNGYSFIEIYSDDANYFGKTALDKKLGSGFSATGELSYGSNMPERIGIGLSYTIPTPKGSVFIVKTIPLWANRGGFDKRIMAGYSGSISLPAGFEVSSFGEFNAISNEWGYGEASIGKKFGKRFGVHYNPLLKNRSERKFVPRVEHALRATYKF